MIKVLFQSKIINRQPNFIIQHQYFRYFELKKYLDFYVKNNAKKLTVFILFSNCTKQIKEKKHVMEMEHKIMMTQPSRKAFWVLFF